MSDNIDQLEQEIIETLYELKTDETMMEYAQSVVDGSIEFIKGLSKAFGAANDPEIYEMIKIFHEMVEAAKEIYDAKGDDTAEEVKSFIEKVKTLNNEEYNDHFAIMEKVYVKDIIDEMKGQKPDGTNPFGPKP